MLHRIHPYCLKDGLLPFHVSVCGQRLGGTTPFHVLRMAALGDCSRQCLVFRRATLGRDCSLPFALSASRSFRDGLRPSMSQFPGGESLKRPIPWIQDSIRAKSLGRTGPFSSPTLPGLRFLGGTTRLRRILRSSLPFFTALFDLLYLDRRAQRLQLAPMLFETPVADGCATF